MIYYYLHFVKVYRGKPQWLIDFFRKREAGQVERNIDATAANRVYLHEPHGPWCTGFIWIYLFDHTCTPLVSSHLLRVPILGVLAKMLGCQAVTKTNIIFYLQKNKTIAIIPSGARGMELTGEDSYIRRSGLFKLINDNKTEQTIIVPSVSLKEHLMYINYPLVPQMLRKYTHKIFGYPGPFFLWGRNTFPILPRYEYHVVQGNLMENLDADTFYIEIDRLLAGGCR